MINWFKKKEKSPTRKTEDLKISVIMPVFLGDYEGAAENREDKFKAAAISFIKQTYTNKELIIVSDGCELACEVWKNNLQYPEVTFIMIDKEPLFSGFVRESGIKMAKGDIIAYLDSDDMLGVNHLQTIASGFNNKETDYVYYNDLLLPPNKQPIPRTVELEHGSIGTSTIAHRNDIPNLSWKGCNGYGHDWEFIQQLIKNNEGKKINGAEYYVCHVPNIF